MPPPQDRLASPQTQAEQHHDQIQDTGRRTCYGRGPFKAPRPSASLVTAESDSTSVDLSGSSSLRQCWAGLEVRLDDLIEVVLYGSRNMPVELSHLSDEVGRVGQGCKAVLRRSLNPALANIPARAREESRVRHGSTDLGHTTAPGLRVPSIDNVPGDAAARALEAARCCEYLGQTITDGVRRCIRPFSD